MRCPKCMARIGIINLQLATAEGKATGISCCICGYWLQYYPGESGALQDAA